MFVRPGFNVYTVLQTDIRGQQHLFSTVHRIGNVVQAAAGSRKEQTAGAMRIARAV